eukprot:Rhum_TRINITY_DN9623_c0_g1::Rhum_TRINITY_DN9623_c0_g1_i1::g.34453::m.34453/K02342/DPO3E, dnaQ; DNA polymerase III subunit epsilon
MWRQLYVASVGCKAATRAVGCPAAAAASAAAAPSLMRAAAHVPPRAQQQRWASHGAAPDAGTVAEPAVIVAGQVEARPKATKAKKNPNKVSPASIFIWDIETTGLARTKDQIIEIGLQHPHSGTLWSALVRPTVATMSPDAFRVHGITMDELRDEPTFADVWEELQAWVNETAGGSGTQQLLFLSHFSHSLDIPMLKSEVERAGSVIPERYTMACSSMLIRSKLPKGAKLSLETLSKHYQVDEEAVGQAHRAISDTLRVWHIFQQIFPTNTLEKIAEIYLLKKEAPKKDGAQKKKSNGMWWKWRKGPKSA